MPPPNISAVVPDAVGESGAHTGDLPPIWVISLERAEARRRSVSRSFNDLGVPFELVDAVDGRALTPDQHRRYSRWRARFTVGRDLTLGDVGCSLSHLAVYQRMVAEAIPEVLVVEDDVEPTPALVDVLAARQAFPRDWQVVTFHSLFPSAQPRPIAVDPLPGGHRVCTYRRIPFGTQCYLVNQSGARRALDVGFPVRMPPDELLYRRVPAGLRVYGIEPSPVVHRDFGSELRTAPASETHGVDRAVEWAVISAGRVWTRLTRPSRMDP